jgi:hypothetical protein
VMAAINNPAINNLAVNVWLGAVMSFRNLVISLN